MRLFLTIVSLLHLESRAAAYSQLGSECYVQANRPTTSGCNARFSIERKSAIFQEHFALSINDPVEYFHYYSRYTIFKPTAFDSTYLRLPVLGHIRDQFIDKDPFNNTLLFTTSVIGVGHEARLRVLEIGADASSVYVKQRYSGNYIHSDIPIDPEKNKIYNFAQFGVLGKSWLAAKIPWGIKVTAQGDFLHLQNNGEKFLYREFNTTANWNAFTYGPLSIGTSLTYFRRIHELNHHHEAARQEFSRAGLYLEFK